jgi:glycosyltransferase involved in cell wall biosynthesis
MSGTDTTPLLSLSVLAYNEEASIERAARLCSTVLESCGWSYELVLVDDGSTDATPRIVEGLSADLPHCRVIRHPRNLGIGAGIRTCYFGTRGLWAVWFPADLQADPRALPDLLPHLHGCDVLVTYRDARLRQEGRMRRFVSRTDRTLVRLLFGLTVRDLHWVRFFRRELLRRMILRACSPGVDTEMLVSARLAGARIREVPLADHPRTAGQARGASLANLTGAIRDLIDLYRRGPRALAPGHEAPTGNGNCPWLDEPPPEPAEALPARPAPAL